MILSLVIGGGRFVVGLAVDSGDNAAAKNPMWSNGANESIWANPNSYNNCGVVGGGGGGGANNKPKSVAANASGFGAKEANSANYLPAVGSRVERPVTRVTRN